MKTRTLLAAVAVLLLGATTVSAGTVYLPLATNAQSGQRTYRTLLWVTNVGNAPAEMQIRYIPTMTNGLPEEGEEGDTMLVAPGSSLPMAPAPGGGLGMAEIVADDSVHFVAELKSFSPTGQERSAASVPLIDGDNILLADEVAHLLALERQVAGLATNLHLVNLSGEDEECTIRAFRADASQIQGTAIVTVPPLGHREFPDAFGILDEPSVDGARFEVSCTGAFYTYATLLGTLPDNTVFVTPSAGGDHGLAGPPADGTIFEAQGTFFNPRQGDSLMEIELPIEAGVRYDSMTVEFDMFVGTLPTNLFTSTAQLRRPVPGGLYWAHTIRGGGRDKTLLDMGVGDSLVHQGQNGVWAQRTPYRVVAIFDTVSGVIDWQVYRGDVLVENIVGGIGQFNLSHNGEGIRLIFGLSKVFDNAFFPPWGFRFSNLRVTGVPTVQ